MTKRETRRFLKKAARRMRRKFGAGDPRVRWFRSKVMSYLIGEPDSVVEVRESVEYRVKLS